MRRAHLGFCQRFSILQRLRHINVNHTQPCDTTHDNAGQVVVVFSHQRKELDENVVSVLHPGNERLGQTYSLLPAKRADLGCRLSPRLERFPGSCDRSFGLLETHLRDRT